MRIAVVGGGISSEHEVSLETAANVRQAVIALGWDPVSFTIDEHGCWLDDSDAPLGYSPARSLEVAIGRIRSCDVLFPALHGVGGEDGTIAALGQLCSLPTVGSPLAACAFAMDKAVTKLMAASVGVLTAPGWVVRSAEELPAPLPFPLVVKPVVGGSSHGLAYVKNTRELAAAVKAAQAFGELVLVEQYVAGREIDIAVFRNANGETIVSPPLEIERSEVFRTVDKYDGSAQFRVPAPLTEDQLSELASVARLVFATLGCDSLARCDFFLTQNGPGRWLLNEVNTTPGMTVESQVPRMFAAAGVSYVELIKALVQAALAASARENL